MINSVAKCEDNDFSFANAFTELKAAGFNTAHTYMTARYQNYREFYEMAVRHNMKLYVSTEAGNNNPDVQTALETVAKECNESAICSQLG